MKVAVIGAGAIGGLVAGYLVDEGEEVLLVTPPEQVVPIAQNGLTIEGVRGKRYARPLVNSQLNEHVDIAILATKVLNLEQSIKQNFTYLKGVPVMSVQNGIRAERIIARHLGADMLFPTIVMFGSTYLAPGKIMHNFEGAWIVGRAHAGTHDLLHEVTKVTAKIFPSPISDDIEGMKWLKLFINANNCLPAIMGKNMQETFGHLPVSKISVRIWQEGWDLVNKAGITLSSLPAFPVERLSQLVSMPLDEAAKIFSTIMLNLSKEPLYGSILQSIRRKRPSEIDYINGEFVNLAASLGQKAPLNERLVQMVHEVEKSRKFFSEAELLDQTREFMS
jgi:2-dehydropantoate 2-reductase